MSIQQTVGIISVKQFHVMLR